MTAPISRAEWRRRKRRKVMIIRIVVFTVLLAIVAALVFGGVMLYRTLFMHEQLGTLSSAGNDEVLSRLLEISDYSRSGARMSSAKGIVIHEVASPGTSAMEQRNYYNSLGTTKANHMSSHFIVDLDGKIVQCIPVNEQALANGARNADTLAIEFCYPSEGGEPSGETYSALVKLTATLVNRFGLTADQIYRHSDISSHSEIVCPAYFQDESLWQSFLGEVMTQAAVMKAKK